MSKRITLEGDVVDKLFTIYKNHGHPLGKTRRGRKKWVSRFVVKCLREMMEKVMLDNEA